MTLDAPRVLVTAAGRRSYLVGWFREAGARVVAADMSTWAPALAVADDAVLLPASADPAYPDLLAEACERHAIDLVLSVNDLDLPVLSAHRDRLASTGARVVVADPDVVALAADKLATGAAVTACGWDSIPTWTDAAAALDESPGTTEWVVKPRYGSGSSAILHARGARELRLAAALLHEQVSRATVAGASPDGTDVLVQPRLHGDEYGLDVVDDLDGRHVVTFVKRKLAMRAGETDKARTEHHPGLERLGAALAARLRHPGVLDVDVMVVGGTPYVLEVNPRFGGGYPFSHVAGADVPRAMLAWLRGEDPDPAWLRVRDGVVAAKYDTLTAIGGPGPAPVRAGADASAAEQRVGAVDVASGSPTATEGARLVPLAVEHLPTRVAWLCDERVRSGITIDFVPDLAGTRTWFGDRDLDRRWDGVLVDGDGAPAAMCGWTRSVAPESQAGPDPLAGPAPQPDAPTRTEADIYLYVDPDRTGRGWGAAAVAALVDRARRERIERLTLTVTATNQAAVALYRRAGFTDVGHLPDRPDRRRLAKDLV